jgi:aryl-alcohol dehydrogenase-like predicted oxidoreductase
VVSKANTMAELRGWTPFVGLQIQYSLLERTVERELLPMARAFGITTTAWAPLAGGVLTGKHTRSSAAPDTKRSNDDRLTPGNLAIARVVDEIADELGRSSAQVAVNWVRQRGAHTIPIVGARKLEQITDLLAATEFELADEHMARLDDVSKVELGFPHAFLGSESVRKVVFGELEASIDLPPAARRRISPLVP